MNTHQQTAIAALEQMKGDDTFRAKAAFLGCSPAKMQEPYGESGKTRQQILDEYKASDAKIDAAIEWVKGAK